ncbi:MAG: MFS transporter [Verrucomicrobiae bacterium]|nr:MFS transporter [Verrucomicrobiae bacterium]
MSDLPSATRRNIACFLWFRILFNCRFYYPVYTILFLDFGLTLRDFALLNAAWAVAIVLLEVPSGALADRIGRRKLVVGAGILMVVEMLVLLLAPVNGGAVLFGMFLLNRILSGAAEAAASGADEALVYDSLPEETRSTLWPKINARLMWIQSLAFVFVTITGAYVYDPGFVNTALAKVGFGQIPLTQEFTLRLPIALTMVTAIATLIVALCFHEPESSAAEEVASTSPVKDSFRNTLRTGGWILRTPPVLLLIVLGMFFDSFIRLYYTVSSEFFRLLDIPVKHFGYIGAVGSLIGMGAAFIVVRMVKAWSPSRNFLVLSVCVLSGLSGLALARPEFGYWGVLLVLPLWLGMRFLHYFLSQYLNASVDSRHRATVLSFKGLSMNLSYGVITLLFGLQTALLRGRLMESDGVESDAVKREVFATALPWWPVAFLIAGCLLYLAVRLSCRSPLRKLLEVSDSRE